MKVDLIKNDGNSYLNSEFRYLENKRRICSGVSRLLALYQNRLYGLSVEGYIFSTKPYNSSLQKGEIEAWQKTGIIAISASCSHAVGLKADGTVVSTGDSAYGQCDISSWKDIAAIATGDGYTIGLKSDGTIKAAGKKSYLYDNWKDIVSITAEPKCVVAVKNNGTVIVAGNISDDLKEELSLWTNIVSVKVGNNNRAVGVKTDGTVIAYGFKEEEKHLLSRWTRIIEVYVRDEYVIGLGADGLVHVIDDNNSAIINSIKNWTNVLALSFAKDVREHVFAVCENGKVIISTGYNAYDCEKVMRWKLFDNYRNLEQKQRENIHAHEEKEAGWQRELNKAEMHLKVLIERKKEAERERNSLNIFQFRRKEELRKEIYQLLLAIDEAKEDIRSIQDYGYIYLGKDEYR